MKRWWLIVISASLFGLGFNAGEHWELRRAEAAREEREARIAEQYPFVPGPPPLPFDGDCACGITPDGRAWSELPGDLRWSAYFRLPLPGRDAQGGVWGAQAEKKEGDADGDVH